MEDEIKTEVIIDFTEIETCTLNNSNGVEVINLTGEISVKNPSDSRIWNGKLNLEGKETTNLENAEYAINEIKANDKWIKPYSMAEDLIESPILSIYEVIDTYYESPAPNWAAIIDKRMPTAFHITAENNSESTLKDIKVIKKLPEYFSEPILEEANVTGTLSYDSGSHEIHWKIDGMEPNSKLEVTIRSGFTPSEPEPYGAGEIKATYTVLDTIRTKLEGSFFGNADNLFAVDVGESLDMPGSWECTAEFENSSSLNTTLKKVKVIQSKENTREIIIEENPNAIVQINQSWTKNFDVKSEGVPKFKTEYVFSINSVIHRKILGSITREEYIIPIVSIQIQKTLEPPEVPAYAKNEVIVKLFINNIGSAALNEFVIVDNIPQDFKPPEKGTIDFFIDSNEIKENISYEIEPNNEDPSLKHILKIVIDNLNQSIGGFKPKNQLLIQYPIEASNPQPKIEHKCPFEVSGNVAPPGPAIKPDIYDLEIGIKYVRRRIRALKQVQPLGEGGQYKIPIIFQNKGEILLENVIIKDIIPPNFQLLNWEPEDIKPEINDLEDGGTQLIWKFLTVEASKKLNFGYTIKGTGEYIAPELEYNVD